MSPTSQNLRYILSCNWTKIFEGSQKFYKAYTKSSKYVETSNRDEFCEGLKFSKRSPVSQDIRYMLSCNWDNIWGGIKNSTSDISKVRNILRYLIATNFLRGIKRFSRIRSPPNRE